MKILLLALVALCMSISSSHGAEIESLNPRWIHSQMLERGVEKAALSMCGGKLHSCDEARRFLTRHAAQCTGIFLAVIDIDAYPEAMYHFEGVKDPRLMLYLKEPSSRLLIPVTLMANPSPDTFAIAMCPEESRAFRHVFKFRSPF